MRYRSEKFRKKIKRFILIFTVTFFTLMVSFPLFWMVSNSFKPYQEIYSYPPTFLPKAFTLLNYQELFNLTGFITHYKNTLIVALTATFLAIIISCLGGYSLSRFRFRGKALFTRLSLVTYMTPTILLVIPIYEIWIRLRLIDTLFSLTVSSISFTLPFGLLLMRSYFQGIPVELEEAAFIDGATRFQAFCKIIFPQALPGVISTGLFTFIVVWQEYLYTLVLINSEAKKTLTLSIADLMGQSAIYSWGMLMAAAVLMVIPVLIGFVFIEKQLIAGFNVGAIKG